MNVMTHKSGWAGYYITTGYQKAFNELGHKCLMFGDWNMADGFNERWEELGKPDLIMTAQSQVEMLPLERIKREGVALVVNCDWLSDNTPIQSANGAPKHCIYNTDLIAKNATLIWHFACQEFINKHYDGWRKLGAKTISLPLGADTVSYKPITEWPTNEFDIGYCGGYWPNKGINLDRYLTPLVAKYDVRVSGPGNWPIPTITVAQERESEFYQQARIAPCISEPHSKMVKYEVLERLFKVLASRAFCISDPALAIPDYFTPEELCVAKDRQEWMDMVQYYIENPLETHSFIDKGYEKVMKEHTYKNRVETLLGEL